MVSSPFEVLPGLRFEFVFPAPPSSDFDLRGFPFLPFDCACDCDDCSFASFSPATPDPLAPAAEAAATGFAPSAIADFFRFAFAFAFTFALDADAAEAATETACEFEFPFVAAAFEFELALAALELVFEFAVILCLELLCSRNPKTLGTYADEGEGRSGARLLKVMRNRCGKVVPKDAPST